MPFLSTELNEFSPRYFICFSEDARTRYFLFRYREALTKELPCLGIEEVADYDVGTTRETVKTEKA